MSTTLPTTVSADTAPGEGVADLTDRRRLLLLTLFGVDVPNHLVDEVFVAPDRAPDRACA